MKHRLNLKNRQFSSVDSNELSEKAYEPREVSASSQLNSQQKVELVSYREARSCTYTYMAMQAGVPL